MMKYLLGILFTFSVFLTTCQTVGTEPETVNCTTLGYPSLCCETRGCVFVNCTDGEKCEFYRDEMDWGEECKTATNQCELLMDTNSMTNSTTLSPNLHFDNNTNSSVEAVTSGISNNDTSTVIFANSTVDSSHSTEGNTSITVEPVPGTSIHQINQTTTVQPSPAITSENPSTAQHTTVTNATEGPYTSNASITQQPVVTTVMSTTTHTEMNITQPTPDNQDVTCQRQFDVASFVGGIVFLAGIAAMCGFMYMYYKSRQDVNYRML